MSETGHHQDLRVDWETYHHLIERLIVAVHQSGWKFDQILCLARGGLRVGDVFSRVFGLPLSILATSSYRENAGQTRGALQISSSMTTTSTTTKESPGLRGRVLLLDDLADSGETLSGVCQHLLKAYPEIESIKTGVLWYKMSSSVAPDFFVEKLVSNPWIHQPFEVYDNISPQELVEKSMKVISK